MRYFASLAILLVALCGCICVKQNSNPEVLLKEQLHHGIEWKKVHAAEGLLEADLAADEVAQCFQRELAASVPNSPWRIGCLRVLHQCDSAQRAIYQREIRAIAFNRQSDGVIHAVETMAKLKLMLSPEETAQLWQYAHEDNLLSAYALMLLAINHDESAFAQLWQQFLAGNTTAAFALFYLDAIPELNLGTILAQSRNTQYDAGYRAFAFRAYAKFAHYSDASHDELLARINHEDNTGALRFYLLTVGDFARSNDAALLTPYLSSDEVALQIASASSLAKIQH
jgi:hypothetical protein